MNSTIDYYEAHAGTLSERYDRVAFEAIHQRLLSFLPAAPASVLDIGAGSGRDAIALARRGYAVTAVEPADAMRQRAQARSTDVSIRWVNDSLPELKTLVAETGHFKFILCSAVLMHIDRANLPGAVRSMSGLLASDGHLAITVRNALPSDRRGIFQSHSNATLIEAGTKANLRIVFLEDDHDQLGRPAIVWRTLVFVNQR